MIEAIKKNWKRHLISAFVTFCAGFVIGIGPLIENFNEHNFTVALFTGIIIVGIRHGVKLVFEVVLTPLAQLALTKVNEDKDKGSATTKKR